MTTDRIERRLPGILTDLAEPQAPDYIDDILSLTARTRQRPGWTFLERWLPMDIAVRRVGAGRPGLAAIILLALLLAVGVAIVAIVGSQQRRPVPPFGPATNGSIIYERFGDIYVTDPGATRERVLVGGDTRDFGMRWSLDGSTIFFGRETAGGTAVMAADADGRNIRQLSSTLISPNTEAVEVSPDGTELVLIDPALRPRSMFVLPLVGDGAMRHLDLGNVEPTTYAQWRPPNGDEIVFLGHPGGVPTELALYIVREDGTDLRPLFMQRDESAETATPTRIPFQNIVLADDGQSAAYWNWETGVDAGRNCFVHLIDLATGEDRRMTYDPTAVCEVQPAFLSGGRILVERQDSLGVAQLLVAPADASASGTLIGPTFHYTVKVGWALSPDREKVLFVRTTGSTRLIWIETGATEDVPVKLPDVGNWQRLAP
jgi:hypothetical protein